MAKIVCISDTHNAHNNIDIPDGDILIHCGDMTMGGTNREFIAFNRWLGTLPHKYKIIIGGNHDLLLDKHPKRRKNTMFSNAKYLENQRYVIKEFGLKIWGSPITPALGYWAFMRKRGYEIAKVWKQIPEDTNLLLTHGPPYGILDMVPRSGSQGCYDLMEAVKRIKPKLHVFGHIHEGYGTSELLGFDTKFVNCAIMDEMYDPIHKAVEIKL